jgi:hypothetical protein
MIKEYGSDLDKSNPDFLKHVGVSQHHEEKEEKQTDKMVI